VREPIRISDLAAVLNAGREDYISIGNVVSALGANSIGIILVILTVPNVTVIPSIPLLPFVMGLPAIALCGTFAATGKVPPLAYWVDSLTTTRTRAVKAARIASKITFFSKPRLGWLTEGLWMRGCAAVACVLTFALCIFPPGLNLLPGLAVLLLALGMAESDGLLVVGGSALGLASIIAEIVLARALF
jgi:hypothetical protein